ncbi:MAG TPA: prenyltransferase/squalene oxidase repeat-containing protein [Kofleriaceae bacterium]|nr:prenyltransferase/squalene oxidase repeat-containing protein [Kofleriaceae bacterium]
MTNQRSIHSCALVAIVGVGLAALGVAGCGAHKGSDDDDDHGHDDAQAVDAPVDALVVPGVPSDCFDAAERGVVWLAGQQTADGSWGTTYKTASTAFAVLKLETYAREIGHSPFDATFPYADQVAHGLDYLMSKARVYALAPQFSGDPDSNGNGLGVYFSTIDDAMYENAVVLMAIVAGEEPTRMVVSANTLVDGRTYRSVAEDAVDYLALAQSDAAGSPKDICARGGWAYGAWDRMGDIGSDNSVTQFVTLALAYARHPRYGYEIPTPPWVLTALRDWVACVQNHDGGPEDGGSGYDRPTFDVDAYKTGALIQQHAFLGDDATAPEVTAALAFLQRVWTDDTGIGWRKSPSSTYLAMYSIMKGMESMALDDLGDIDWYRQFCDQLKTEQLADGSWPTSDWDPANNDPLHVGPSGLESTEWALLTLERAAPPPEPVN